ncbi:MAG: insulinase family protein [Muribaculaceae bacterium]|nr:insulinase family protein [Muribaculaceae bacterium]
MFEIKRNKHITDLKIKLEKVLYQASLGIIGLNYGQDHPFSREETPEEIASLTRDNVIDIYRSVITKYPPTIYLSGMIDNELTDRVITAFSPLSFESAPEPYIVIKRQAAPGGSTVKLPMPGKKQSGIKIAIPAINADHPDFLLLNIAVTALGGYFGSRLVMNIREDKGYTYGISARLISFKEGGTVSITCECDNKYVDAVIDEIKKELVRLASEPMDDDELRMVTRYMKSSLAACLDNAFSISEYHKGLIRSNKGSSEFYRLQELLSTVTPEDIRTIAARLLNPTKILISVAGDVNQA